MEADSPIPPLQVRLYGTQVGDYQMVSGWWQAHDKGDFYETLLPPLGVIVSRGGVDVGAMWCYECFGIGVCFLEYALSAPGLSLHESQAHLSFAIESLVTMAKEHGDFSIFRCHTTPSIARILPGMGFHRSHSQAMQSFIFRRD